MPKFFINVFYESKFRDNLFIVKASGKVIEDEKYLKNLLLNIKDITRHGIKVLLVYGGGRAIDEEAEKRGIKVKKHQGRRVTCAETIEVMKDVVGGKLAMKVYESMATNGVEGLCLNAVPAEWLDVSLRPKKPIDFGFVGNITQAHSRPIRRLFKVNDFIAVPCLAWAKGNTRKPTISNINADTIATEIAIATKSDKLIFMSDVDGVSIKGKTAFIITAEQIPGYIKDGTVYGGMQVKLENCARALKSGVKRIHLINGLLKDSLKNEIFEPIGPGTMLITESERENYLNEVAAQKVIEGSK